MKINAYLLAADPTWARTSLATYYPLIERLVVCYDAGHLGWGGKPVPVAESLAAIEDSDAQGKVEHLTDDFRARTSDLMRAETTQRQAALDLAGQDAEWVLQLDSDELLPDADALLRLLQEADEQACDAVEWPMRVLFNRTTAGSYLEVREADGRPHYEYPGAVAVRSGTVLADARRSNVRVLRATVEGQEGSLQLRAPRRDLEVRMPALTPEQAIWHKSWARAPRVVRSKLASWGHGDLRLRSYYYRVWRPAPVTWRLLRDFHPFAAGLWPRLAPLDADLFPVHPSERGQ